MIKLYYNDYEYLLEVDGVRCTGGMVEILTSRDYTLSLCPYADGMSWIPITARLHVSSTCEITSGVTTAKIGDDEFILLPSFVPAVISRGAEVLLQRNYDEHTVTVYSDIVTHLIVENQHSYESVIIPECPRVIERIHAPEGYLFTAVSDSAIIVIMYDYNDYKIILDRVADKVDFDENGITITTNICDSQGRIVSEHLHYENGNYQSDGLTIEYSNSHKSPPELIAYDYIESVLASDYEYADKLLNIADMTSIIVREFIGEYDTLIIANKIVNTNDTILLTNRKGKYQSYHLTVEDNKIVDIDEC